MYEFTKKTATTMQVADLMSLNPRSQMLLDRILFWSNHASVEKHGKIWIAKSREAWSEETTLSLIQVKKALADLRSLTVIETRQSLFAGKNVTHLRLTDAADIVVRQLLEYSKISGGWKAYVGYEKKVLKKKIAQSLIRPKNAASTLEPSPTTLFGETPLTEAPIDSQTSYPYVPESLASSDQETVESTEQSPTMVEDPTTLSKGATQGEPQGCHSGGTIGCHSSSTKGCHSLKEHVNKTEGKQEMKAFGGNPKLLQAVQAGKEKSKKAVFKKKSSGAVVDLLRIAWRDACIKHHEQEGMQLIAGGEKMRLAQINSSLFKADFDVETRIEFIEWVVEHWSDYIAEVKMSKGHTKTPKMPSIPYLLSNINTAFVMWAAKDQPVQLVAQPEKVDPWKDTVLPEASTKPKKLTGIAMIKQKAKELKNQPKLTVDQVFGNLPTEDD